MCWHGGMRAGGWPTAGTGRAGFGLATPGARYVISSSRSGAGMGVSLVAGDITTPGCHRAQRRTHQGMVGNNGDHPSHHLCGGSCKWHSGAMKRNREKCAGVDRRHREKNSDGSFARRLIPSVIRRPPDHQRWPSWPHHDPPTFHATSVLQSAGPSAASTLLRKNQIVG